MKTIIDITLLTLITIYIVDLSGIKDTLLDFRSHLAGKTIKEWKPFTCSLCMTWWVGITYAIIAGEFNLPIIAFVALLSMLSSPLCQLLTLVRELLNKAINSILVRL